MFTSDTALKARVVAAANCEPRRNGMTPRYVMLHYTGMASAQSAIDWLAREDSRVSCHYVVDDDGTITQMVPEALRAWHAGASYWRGETDLNSASVGIEIQNPGHDRGYPDFPAAQVQAVLELTRDIVKRHGLPRDAIIAHSDVAPDRKIDPGEKFPWAHLAKHGLGDWVPPVADEQGPVFGIGDRHTLVADAQRMLGQYGYRIDVTGAVDEQTAKVIRAFQLRFRPIRVDGRLDRSTLMTLERLVSATVLIA